jgi:hypothetical protein
MRKSLKTNAVTSRDMKEITEALAAPFQLHDVKFKPAVVSGNRALALAYVDARVIQDRLDEVLGVDGWQDSYKVLEDGTVVCRLRLRIGQEWVTKTDVGSPSEQGDSGDQRKAAFSDALKRAAVKFGVGRYLYRLRAQWVDYDGHKKQFTQTPKLPPFAMPRKAKAAAGAEAAPEPQEARKAQATEVRKPERPEVTKIEPVEARKARTASSHVLPANGVELQRRLYDYDTKLSRQGLCAQGELVKHVVAAGVSAGFDPDLSTWAGQAIQLAAEATRTFEARAREAASGRREVA